MLEFFDEDFDNIPLVEGALELNKAINPETKVHWAKQELERLYKDAEATLVHETDEEQRFDAFLRLFSTSGDSKATSRNTLFRTTASSIKCWSAEKVFL